jgi:hypothetical protein
MIQSKLNYNCGECIFSTDNKLNLKRHYKRKHPSYAQDGEHVQGGGGQIKSNTDGEKYDLDCLID